MVNQHHHHHKDHYAYKLQRAPSEPDAGLIGCQYHATKQSMCSNTVVVVVVVVVVVAAAAAAAITPGPSSPARTLSALMPSSLLVHCLSGWYFWNMRSDTRHDQMRFQPQAVDTIKSTEGAREEWDHSE
ncbi:hypothetical protein BKA66DRAFT_219205 [Pyrenochaeta sp. MPI-SDFR-AT-0127]|nr:hypothetical protein BKA66DRAFT_219205 [Pyrenochaeta sp. MPI-SDFR-AT-0127]